MRNEAGTDQKGYFSAETDGMRADNISYCLVYRTSRHKKQPGWGRGAGKTGGGASGYAGIRRVGGVAFQTDRAERKRTEGNLFYGQMESRQVDELLTGLALQAGLFPVSLSIDEPRREIPAVYPWHSGIREAPADGTERASGTDAAPGTDDTGTGEDTGEGADGTGEDTGEGADGTGENTGEGAGTDSAMPPVIYMQMTGATLVLRGSEEAIFAFIDSVADHYPAIRIRSMDRDRRVFLGPELEVLEETDVRFELDICMYGWSL